MQTTVTLQQSSAVVPVPNASLMLREYALIKRHEKVFAETDIHLIGKVTPYSHSKIFLNTNFQLTIGGITGHNLSISAADFEVKKEKKKIHYIYKRKGIEIEVSESGTVVIDIERANLSSVDESQLGNVKIYLDSIYSGTNVTLTCRDEGCFMKPLHGHEGLGR